MTSRYSYLATLGIIPILIILGNKLYIALLESGKQIAFLGITIFILIFSIFHIVSIQQSVSDWAGASVRTKNFFVSFDSSYSNYWASNSVNLHFINVPIKYGQAWVFPVGLKDAIWFAVKNDKARIYQDKDLNTALSLVDRLGPDKVFVFNDDGSISDINLKTGLINK
jgi:hypothetical protein